MQGTTSDLEPTPSAVSLKVWLHGHLKVEKVNCTVHVPCPSYNHDTICPYNYS